jgi:hypothetical protein
MSLQNEYVGFITVYFKEKTLHSAKKWDGIMSLKHAQKPAQ